MNKVLLMGRLTADPELKYTPFGTAVVRFTIAVNSRSSKDGKQADFINCVAWRKTAEFIQSWFFKGSMIAICGKIQTRSWDGNDGQKHYATEVIAEEAYFTGEKKQQGNNTINSINADYDGFEGFQDVDESDLPF